MTAAEFYLTVLAAGHAPANIRLDLDAVYLKAGTIFEAEAKR